jgi:hypothetical protein
LIRSEKHKKDKDCVRISYEGTAKPVPADSSVDFDIKGQGVHFHVEHLKTEQLLKDWIVNIAEQVVYNTSHDGCSSPDDLPQSLTEDITVAYSKGTTLFKNNKHPDSNDKDDAVADADCKIKFRVTVIVKVRRTKCYTVARLDSELPQPGEAAVAVAPKALPGESLG